MILTVQIEIPDVPLATFEEQKDAWFPLEDRPSAVSVDRFYLEVDPTEDSYHLFKFIKAEES